MPSSPAPAAQGRAAPAAPAAVDATAVPVPEDPLAPEVVVGLDGVLATFNRAGVLSAADVHTALRLARLTGTEDDLAVLGAAFAVRAPRFGHVFADLPALADTVTDEDGRIVGLPPEVWPDVAGWVEALGASPLVTAAAAPLRLEGTRLYLDRYWRHEDDVADAIAGRAGDMPATWLSDTGVDALARVFDGNDEQHAAASAALRSTLAVVAGGPGTGKTSTVARMVGIAALHARRDGAPIRIAIAAPTGKAAARLGEALRDAAARMPADMVASGLLDPRAVDITPTTLHKLLGGTWARTRFRHHADNPLPHDLVIVDEVSMVALSMLDRLLDALRPDARLVLVGDPDQLAAVEAGTVLGDVIAAADRTSLGGQVVTLTTNHRSDTTIIDLASRIREGDADGALDLLAHDPDDLREAPLALVTPQVGRWPDGTGSLAGVRELLQSHARDAIAQARDGDVDAALASTMAAKVLCAHRRGLDGVSTWNAAVEGWALDVPSYRRPAWYPGRPVMATRNDHALAVFNGDIGVVVRDGDRFRVAIDGRPRRPVEHRRIGEVQTVHAMTVHKSQGSQFDDVVVVLPADPSPILTRELLYTAVTRARRSVVIVGTEEALVRGISRPVARASGLADRLVARLG